MTGTPKEWVDKQCRRRLRGKVIPPCVRPFLAKLGLPPVWRSLPITTPYGATSPIGKPWSLGRHTGEDHAAPIGAHACATSWGVVVCVALWAPGGVVHATGPVTPWGLDFGTHVVIRTGDGRFDYALCHLSSVAVAAGDHVKPGQTIGRTGETGNTEGPHLHLEARPAGGRFGTDLDPINVKRKAPQ